MKRIAIIIAALALVGCDRFYKSETAGGKPYEIVVSIRQSLWDGAVGDTLRSVLNDEVEMLPQVEPMFDIVRVNPQALGNVILRHRNILEVAVSDTLKAPISVARYDVYSQPQIIVSLAAPDTKSLTEYISSSREELQLLFEITERNRAISNARQYGERNIENDIFRTFGVHLNIPKGFKERNRIGDDWMWISNEFPLASEGIVIYSYPYTGVNDLTMDAIMTRRNEFVKLIPGAVDGSYMTTNLEATTTVRYVRINGRPWAEIRSLWDVVGDAMGGPAVTYATIDATGKRVLTIDCYLYSPDKPKRNMLHALEHIAYSAQFPEKEE